MRQKVFSRISIIMLLVSVRLFIFHTFCFFLFGENAVRVSCHNVGIINGSDAFGISYGASVASKIDARKCLHE